MKRYPLSILSVLIITILSLYPITEIKELTDVPLMDKWVHVLMYGGLTAVLWWEHHRQSTTHSPLQLIIRCIAFPTMFGGLMELCQAYLTTCRSGDWLDFLANSIGVLLGTLLSLLTLKLWHK